MDKKYNLKMKNLNLNDCFSFVELICNFRWKRLERKNFTEKWNMSATCDVNPSPTSKTWTLLPKERIKKKKKKAWGDSNMSNLSPFPADDFLRRVQGRTLSKI